ncbi:TonB-dependent receptor [Sphingomonas sp. HITSZ_GF]|uniref:TonB-dependent receptor plug domain-containing protein n=1 Tax=Sphingomonas sp. HITSZ_GF TaxID=3037247 RepID=UPI00240D2197|nr:TonB-dependent receptor [Sphingomonas sp. HITSZ_GF]MDG2534725.1 TonB-dependent receptor [Sphingomonas sp. HITSZ_GF]
MNGTQITLRAGTALSALALAFAAAPQAMAQTTDDQTNAGQTADQTAPAAQAAETAGDIIVTGSRIRRSNFSSPEPLTVISKDEMTQAGFSSVSDALQSTAVTQGSSQINNYYGGYVVDGGTGVNSIGLRGLGATRTLVLLNGHRLSPAGTRGSVGSVDLNSIPDAIVKRIEVLKAGASSIYGSDAVAGVINILTDDSIKGLVLEAQTNVPEVGAGTANRLSASFGAHGDRWHLIGSVDYYNRSSLTIGDTDFARCPIGGYLSGAGTAMGSGDYIDPATGQSKCWSLDNGGLTINTLGVPTRTATPAAGETATAFNRLRPNAAVTGGNTPGYEGVGNYTRTTFDPAMLNEQVVTPLRTYTGFLSGSYDLHALGDAQVYVELLGNRRQSSSLGYRQLTLDYATGSLLVPTMFRSGVFSSATAVSNGQTVAARSFIGYGLLNSSQDVYTYRTAGGIRGNLGLGDWSYDAYGAYSWMRSSYATDTFITSKVAKSLNVVQNTDGSFSCVDSSGGCVAAPAINAASIGGNLSQAYRDYITDTVVGHTKFDEITGAFNVNGSLFKLPGGNAAAALGFEYRHDQLNDQPPIESVNGDMYNLTSATPTVGSDEVWEAYGELNLPLLANLPFVHALTIDGSGRYTHYRSYGGQWTYKGSATYEPVKGFGLRTSYGTSYRAPALFEQYLGATSGFLSGSYDPCDNYATSSNPIIQRNCAAAGLPGTFTQTGSVTVLTAGGAETGLRAETSKNFSAGAVINPVLPGKMGVLSASLDYFSIEVDNEVSRVGASGLLNLCYGSANFPSSSYCNYVTRDANNQLTVQDNYINISTDKRRGWEFDLRYQNRMFGGTFLVDAMVTKYVEQSSRVLDGDALVDANGTIGSPDWTGSLNASYRSGPVTLHYGIDWIKGSSNDRVAKYVATDSDTGIVDQATYELIKDNYYLGTPDYFLHNASIQFDIERYELTMGVRNLFDQMPPSITSGVYSMVGNSPLYSGYDYTGRTFYLNVTARF